jgi:hypothetical protein
VLLRNPTCDFSRAREVNGIDISSEHQGFFAAPLIDLAKVNDRRLETLLPRYANIGVPAFAFSDPRASWARLWLKPEVKFRN